MLEAVCSYVQQRTVNPQQNKHPYPHVFQYKCLNSRCMRSTVKKKMPRGLQVRQ